MKPEKPGPDDELRSLMENYLPADADLPGERYKSGPPGKKPPESAGADLLKLIESSPDPVPKEGGASSAPAKPGSGATPVLDLHYYRLPDATAAASEFLEAHAANPAIRKVLIITGKGLGSPNYQPTIKPAILSLLKTRFQRQVDYVQDAPPTQGGSGALLIFLRR